MNKLLQLMLIDIKLLSKSKVFYLKLILFPSILILILGTMFGSSSTKLTKFNVAFYSEDVSDTSHSLNLGNTLRDDVLQSKNAKSLFTLQSVDSYNQGKKLVNDKKADAFICVPNDFTKSYIANTKTSSILIADNNSSIDKAIVKNILDRFYKSIETLRTEETVIKDNVSQSRNVNTAKLQNMIAEIQSNDNYDSELTTVSTGKNSKPLTMITYESIAMIVMFSILTAFELAHNIVNDKLNNTQFRIKSTPTFSLQYILGKILGMMLAVSVQMFIVMLVSHYAYKAEFGNILYVLLTTICYGFTVGAIVFCAGIAAKDHSSISSFASLILYGGSFLGGSFVSANSLPDVLAKIQQIIPNGKAINCLLKICQGGNISDIAVDLITLIFIGLVFLAISLHFYSERSSFKNADNNNDKESIKAAV